MIFNYACTRDFIQRGQLDLTIQYPLSGGAVLNNGFDGFSITLIVYDIDENLLLTENAPNFKKDDIKFPQAFNNNNIHTFNDDPFNKKMGY